MGYDVHRLVGDRKLIIGGVEIEHDKGLLGHSDADVLTHAVMDALLGAAALGDIGRHFPDTSGEFKGISSLVLLERVDTLIREKGYIINNIDCTIVAQKPRMSPYISAMINNFASILKIDSSSINIKATTTEGLGFVGRQEGISSYAIVSLINKE